MQALKELREKLLAAPLGLQPEDVTTMAQAGTVRSYYRRENERGGKKNYKFRVEYTGKLYVLGTQADIESLFFIVTTWLDAVNPSHGPTDITFNIDFLNDTEYDLEISIANLMQTYNPLISEQGTAITDEPRVPPDPVLRTENFTDVSSGESDGRE